MKSRQQSGQFNRVIADFDPGATTRVLTHCETRRQAAALQCFRKAQLHHIHGIDLQDDRTRVAASFFKILQRLIDYGAHPFTASRFYPYLQPVLITQPGKRRGRGAEDSA